MKPNKIHNIKVLNTKFLTCTIMILLLLFSDLIYTQNFSSMQDSTLNNLVHPEGYKTCKLGELGNVKTYGTGKQSMILVPGIGFGGEIFDSFMEANKDKFTMYAITPAGFGGTQAPPMPDTSVTYSELTWTNGIVTGILNLIEKENLKDPIIVAHFITGTQVAFNLALAHPKKIKKVIIISGHPYNYIANRKPDNTFDWPNEVNYTPEKRSELAQNIIAPKWFKTVTNKTWIENNWKSGDYTKDSVKGKELALISSQVPLQVNIRYLTEFFTYDITSQYYKIQVPTLILIPSYDDKYFTGGSEYMKYLGQASWESAKDKNPLFVFKTIPNSRIFMWYDNPIEVYKSINEFLAN